MLKSIILFIITLILIILSINNLDNNSTQITLESLATFFALIFILVPLLIYSIYLMITSIEEFLNNNKNDSFLFKLFYYLFYALKIVYGLALVGFGILIIFYDIEKGWENWLTALIHISIIITSIRVGGAVIYTTFRKIKTKTDN